MQDCFSLRDPLPHGWHSTLPWPFWKEQKYEKHHYEWHRREHAIVGTLAANGLVLKTCWQSQHVEHQKMAHSLVRRRLWQLPRQGSTPDGHNQKGDKHPLTKHERTESQRQQTALTHLHLSQRRGHTILHLAAVERKVVREDRRYKHWTLPVVGGGVRRKQQ